MGLFTRTLKPAKIAKAVSDAKALIEAVEKTSASPGGMPFTGASVIQSVPGQPYNYGAGDVGNPNNRGQFNPLPRPFGDANDGNGYGAVMGPGYPLLPASIDQNLDSSGRPLPRFYQYRIAENLDLTFENQPWHVLRSLVETCDLVHRACEIRISDITRMDISWSLTDQCIDEIMADQNVSHSKAARIGREKYGKMLASLEEFWENPYPQINRSYDEWITEFMWNHLTYDGTPVYPRFNLRGNLMGLELIDPSTIKVLLDNRGGRPLPPAPAFQQVLWGFPRGEFVAEPEAENADERKPKNLYAGAGRNGEFMTDQLAYFKRNPRTWSAYGYSVVEQCIPAATLWLERQSWLLADYQSGSMAAGYIEAPSSIVNQSNIANWNRILNDPLQGQNGQRQLMQYIPEGSKVTFAPTNEQRYKADLDEFAIKRIAAIVGISPQTLGVIPRAGLGGGKGAQEGEAENAEVISQIPMLNFLAGMMNSTSRRWLGADKNVTAVFNDRDGGSQTDLVAAQANQIALYSGQKVLNDIQEASGRPSYEMPEADEPFILGQGGQPIFLNGLYQKQIDAQTKPEAPNDSQESDDGQAQEGQGQGKPEGQGSSGPTPLGVESSKDKEAKAFAKFLKSGKTRDFEFRHHTPDEVEALKAASGEILKELATLP